MSKKNVGLIIAGITLVGGSLMLIGKGIDYKTQSNINKIIQGSNRNR